MYTHLCLFFAIYSIRWVHMYPFPTLFSPEHTHTKQCTQWKYTYNWFQAVFSSLTQTMCHKFAYCFFCAFQLNWRHFWSFTLSFSRSPSLSLFFSFSLVFHSDCMLFVVHIFGDLMSIDPVAINNLFEYGIRYMVKTENAKTNEWCDEY